MRPRPLPKAVAPCRRRHDRPHTPTPATRYEPATPVRYAGDAPRAASSCEPPQGRKAARISKLCRVREGPFVSSSSKETHVALALYRKYRPQSFGEVIGQEHVTEPLMQALRTDRLNPAYLSAGPRGCGKTTSARILARSVNCAQGPTPDPCGVCDSCVALGPDGNGSVDVIELDAPTHGARAHA